MMPNNNKLPPGLVSNLQDVLLSRKPPAKVEEHVEEPVVDVEDEMDNKPVVLVTSGDGIDSPGLSFLLEGLVKDGSYNVHVCAPQSLHLQDVLLSRKPPAKVEEEPVDVEVDGEMDKKPVVLVTSGDGIESPGLSFLVEGLVKEGNYNVHVCAPQSDRSGSGHSVTCRESIAVTPVQISGATAYEVSGTPVDCVSLALSGALFSWTKPLLVISGINKGSSCGHDMYYSGVVAGAREALMSGVPSVSISLKWKKDESQDSDFKDAVSICLPLVNAAAKASEQGNFPKNCFLDIQVPTSPSTNKGFKLTKQSLWRSAPSWQAISANRSAGRFMSNQQSLGVQLAQLGRDASAAGAARRLGTQKQSLEIVESVGVAGKTDANLKVKYFRLEFMDKEQEDLDEDLDFRALENGFVAVTPLSLTPHVDSETQTAVSDWISSAIPT